MSSIPRLFVAQDLVEGAAFPLDDAQANYLLRVLRLVADAPVRVFNGRDGEWEARIVDVHGKRASLTPERLVRPQPETPASAPVLLFAPVKKLQRVRSLPGAPQEGSLLASCDALGHVGGPGSDTRSRCRP